MTAIKIKATRIKHGIAPCLGMGEAFEVEAFFFILGAAIQTSGKSHQVSRMTERLIHFLNKLSKAARASSMFRGAGMTPFCEILIGAAGSASRATVKRGENSSHQFA